jgi:hypothetical protein
MSLVFSDCGPERLPALRAFFEREYGSAYRLATDEPLLRWQFSAPMEGAPDGYRVKLAVADGQIEGCLGYVPVQFSVAGARVRAAWTANWMVSRRYRSVGLGPLLMETLVADHDAVFSLGLSDAAIQVLPRMGWTDFGDLTRYVTVLDEKAAAPLTVAGTLAWPDRRHRPERAADVAWNADLPPGDVDALWDRVWGHGAGTRRSTTYVHWRYLSHPVFSYRVLSSRSSDGQLDGFAVYRVEQVRDHAVRVGRIVELFSLPRRAAAVIDAVLLDAAREGVALLDFFCASRSLDGPLGEAGFLSGSDARVTLLPILYQPVVHGRSAMRFMGCLRKLPQATGVAEWYVTKSDGDQDRPN